MRRIILILFFLVPGVALAGGELKTIKQTKELSDSIVGHFLKGQFQQGLEIAKPHWPLPQVEIDGLANQIETQWPVVNQRFGKPAGMEFVKEERLGKSFVRYFYLHKFQNHSIYWRLTFYKPVKAWKVNGILFLDKLDPLFEPVD